MSVAVIGVDGDGRCGEDDTMVYLAVTLLFPVVAVLLLMVHARKDFWHVSILLIMLIAFFTEIFCLFEFLGYNC
jgi:membrane protein YdbS with pleckstrin-like domain